MLEKMIGLLKDVGGATGTEYSLVAALASVAAIAALFSVD